jgi:hypothetical protein
MHYIRYLLLRFIPGCVQLHCFQFNPHPCDQVRVYADSVWGGCSVVLETIFFRTFTLCTVTDSKPPNCLPTSKKS